MFVFLLLRSLHPPFLAVCVPSLFRGVLFQGHVVCSQRLLLSLGWMRITCDPGSCSVQLIAVFSPLMGTGADLQWTSSLISASVLYVACALHACSSFAMGRAPLGLRKVVPCCSIFVKLEVYSIIL